MGERWMGMDATAVPVPDAGDDTLRLQVVETLRKYSDRADGYQTGADKVMELIREHTAGLALGMQSWRERALAAEAELERVEEALDGEEDTHG